MRNLMLDLETLGTRPGSVILSIGAVFFDANYRRLGPEFYSVISTGSCDDSGLTADARTVAWWRDQSPDARKVFDAAGAENAPTLRGVLGEFIDFIRTHNALDNVCVWGNGSDFDNALLAEAYARCGSSAPWKFWNNRCYRTLKSITAGPALSRVGTAHNALDDARSQALHAIELMRANPGLVV